MSLVDHASTHVRAGLRLEPAKLAVTSGVRAAFVTVLPLLVGLWLHEPLASWVGFGGFLTTVVDKGGAYRTRAVTTGLFALSLAISVFVGAVFGAHTWAAVPLMFLWGVGCSLVRVYGLEMASVGSSSAIAFAVSLASPVPTVSDAAIRGLLALVGAGWAMSLMLSLWPVRFYRPVRLALATCYANLADYLEALGEAAARAGAPPDWGVLAHRHHLRIRQSLEAARLTSARSRRGRTSESRRGGLLILLLERADQLFAVCATLNDALDGAYAGPDELPVREEVGRVLRAASETLRSIETTVETEASQPRLVIDWRLDGLAAAVKAMDPPAAGGAQPAARSLHFSMTVETIGRLRGTIERVAREIDGLQTDGPARRAVLEPAPMERPWAERVLAPLRANLNPGSVVLRHALRVGTMASMAVVLAALLHLHFGYWITIAVIIVLQPYTGATTLKGFQRVVGTVAGGALATLLAATIHQEAWIMVAIFLLAGTSVALLPINYAVYSTFMTPTFVLLTELRVGDWQLVRWRILANLLGSGLALTGALLLWPSPERTRFPTEISAALQALSDYLQAAIRIPTLGDPSARQRVVEARRRLGLAYVNADASLQRLVAESPGREAELEPCLALLVHTRRLSSSITALTQIPLPSLSDDDRALLNRSTEVLQARLRTMRASFTEERLPAQTIESSLQWPVDSVPLKSQLERVERRLADLEGVARRWKNAWKGSSAGLNSARGR